MSRYLKAIGLFSFALLISVFLAACEPPDGNGKSHTLSGNVASPSGISVPDGTYAYLKLVESGGLPTDQAQYWTRSSVFSGGSASYSVIGVNTGSYTGHAFIDMNAHASNDAAAMPDPGDYALQNGKSIDISDDQTLQFDSSGWIKVDQSGFSILGFWSSFLAYAKYTGVGQFEPDGTYTSWEDHAGTILGVKGTWSLIGDVLTIGVGGDTVIFPLEWWNENQVELVDDEYPGMLYRRDFEPDGKLFNNPKYSPITLDMGTQTEGSLSFDGIALYQYVAGPNAQNAVVSWQDRKNSAYTAHLEVWVYEDEETLAYPGRATKSPINVAMTQGQTYYVVVANQPGDSGTFSIMVSE